MCSEFRFGAVLLIACRKSLRVASKYTLNRGPLIPSLWGDPTLLVKVSVWMPGIFIYNVVFDSKLCIILNSTSLIICWRIWRSFWRLIVSNAEDRSVLTIYIVISIYRCTLAIIHRYDQTMPVVLLLLRYADWENERRLSMLGFIRIRVTFDKIFLITFSRITSPFLIFLFESYFLFFS